MPERFAGRSHQDESLHSRNADIMKQTLHQLGLHASTLYTFIRPFGVEQARQEALMGDALVTGRPLLLDRLEEQAQDSLIALIALAAADTRPGKIDGGGGVFRAAPRPPPIP